MLGSGSVHGSLALRAVLPSDQRGGSTDAADWEPQATTSGIAGAESDSLGTRWTLNKQRRKLELLRPNFLVRWAFYFSILAIPFARMYVPGTGDHIGVKRVVQALIIGAMLSRPRVCLRFAPIALLWFAAYACIRLIAGLWLAPEFASSWWPTSLELLEFFLPWLWILFNVLQYRGFKSGGLWALALGAAVCALFHVLGIGTVDVDKGIDGRSTVFGQNANEIGDIYGLALVGLVALGLFRSTKQKLRLLIFPLAGLVAIAMAKTGSRSGFLFAAVGILLLLPQTRAFVPRTKRYVTLLLVAAVFAGVLYQIPTVLNRLAPLASSSTSIKEQEGRARMIPVLWEIFLRNPIYGSGPDKYQYELTRRAMPYLTEKQQTISAHNLALLLLVETGLIGFVVFSVGLGKALLAAWRARVGSCGLLPLAWLLPLTIAGLTIASPIYNPVFWLSLGYALAGPNPELCYAHRINRFES